MEWSIREIDEYIPEIKTLFLQNHDHKHADNYLKRPLFEYTKFARMGWEQGQLIYYSAGIERPEYNGGIRIMSRHTRDRDYNWGSVQDDLDRGLSTLSFSTQHALDLGYKDIWVSREENPKLLKYFQEKSFFNWELTQEEIPKGGLQWVLRLA